MNGETRFDDLARELASGDISRRSALKRLVGGALGIGAAIAPSGGAEAMGGGCPGDRVKCNGRCCPKNARCKNGRCRCKRGFTKCNRKCVDLETSVNHCGACGIVCAAGESCVAGTCVPPLQCTTDADCDDGLFCNGLETCVAGTCVPGTPPNCDDGISCTADSCNEALSACINTPNDAACSSGNQCTSETCDPAQGCVSAPVGAGTACSQNGGTVCDGAGSCV